MKELIDLHKNQIVFIYRVDGKNNSGTIIFETDNFITLKTELGETVSISKSLIKEIAPKREGGQR